MRVCLSVRSHANAGMKLAAHFGESALFVIYDTQLERFSACPCAASACRGPCQCQLPALDECDFEFVICRSIGARAFNMLSRKKIEVLQTQEEDVMQAIQAWKTKTLKPVVRGHCRPDALAQRRAASTRKK